MFFGKKEEKKEENVKSDIEQIKKVVETKPKVEEVKEEKREAPLFIKLEKYDELIKEIQETKVLQSKLKEIISSLHQVNEAMIASLKAIESLTEAIESKIEKIDKTLVRPSLPYSPQQSISYEVEELEDKIASLKKELDELQKIF